MLQIFSSGSEELNQLIRVLFGTASFTGGFLGFVLDNIVPGRSSAMLIILDMPQYTHTWISSIIVTIVGFCNSVLSKQTVLVMMRLISIYI
jgi:hypothetical protein